MSLNNLSKQIYAANVAKGFYEDGEAMLSVIALHAPDLVPAFKQMQTGQRFALITSEISEALESDRKNRTFRDGTKDGLQQFKEKLLNEPDDEYFKADFERVVKDTLEDELADTMIRCFDFAGANDIDIDFHVEAKLRYNALRPHKHGKTY